MTPRWQEASGATAQPEPTEDPDPQQLRIEYHPPRDANQSKTPDDSVTIDLASRQRANYTPNVIAAESRQAPVRALALRKRQAFRAIVLRDGS
jgi:hypothetical protein